MNKFNLMDEVFYLDFHKTGFDILPGVVTGMKIANVIDHRGHLKKNTASVTQYLINQFYYREDIEDGYSYDLGDSNAETIFCDKVFKTYDEAFEYLNNYVQEKKR